MSNITTSMKLVVVARLAAAALAVGYVRAVDTLLFWVPDSDGPRFPRLHRAVSQLRERLTEQFPEWIEWKGDYILKLKTTRGQKRIQFAVDNTPGWLYRYWLRASAGLMGLLVLGWGVVVLAVIGAAAGQTWKQIPSAVQWIATKDWAALLQPREQNTQISIEELLELVTNAPVLTMVGDAAIALVLSILLTSGLMLFLLPGLTLHEFGHYAVIRKAGATVDNYGILVIGPMVVGAYVQPADDFEDLSIASMQDVMAAGVGNSFILATGLLTSALLVAENPAEMLTAIQTLDRTLLWQQPIPAVLLLLGLVETSNALVNSLPFGSLDGGLYIRAAENEWLGFDDSADLEEKVDILFERLSSSLWGSVGEVTKHE